MTTSFLNRSKFNYDDYDGNSSGDGGSVSSGDGGGNGSSGGGGVGCVSSGDDGGSGGDGKGVVVMMVTCRMIVYALISTGSNSF